MLPVLPYNNKDAVLLGVFVIGVLPSNSARIFDKRAEGFARAVAADDEDFTRRAGVNRFLIRVRAIETQRLQLPVPDLALQFF